MVRDSGSSEQPVLNGPKHRIGGVFRWLDGRVSIQCEQCHQDFDYFTEFLCHMDEHSKFGAIVGSQSTANDSGSIDEYSGACIPKVEIIENEDVTEVDDEWDAHYRRLDEDNDDDYDDGAGRGAGGSNRSRMDVGTEWTKTKPSKGQAVQHKNQQFLVGEHFIISNKLYKCLTCGREMKNRCHMNEHLMTHFKQSQVFCPLCRRSFLAVSYVYKHCIRTHKQKFSTDEIRKAQQSIDLSELQVQPIENILMSSKEPPANDEQPADEEGQKYRCLYCAKWFLKLRFVQRHMRMVHTEVVSLNDIRQRQPTPLGGSDPLDSDDDCEEAPTTSGDRSVAKKELIESDNDVEMADEQQSSSVTSKYECTVCHKIYKNAASLRKHVGVHSGLLYLCPYCDRKTTLKRYLYDHIVTIHKIPRSDIDQSLIATKSTDEVTVQGEPTIYECYLCKRMLPKRSTLLAHMQSHTRTSDAMLVCPICGGKFKSNDTLRHHLVKHERGDEPVKCLDPNCPKTFASEYYMKIHHHAKHVVKAEPKPPRAPPSLECRRCHEVFQDRSGLRRHKKRYKCYPPVQCNVCEKQISRGYYTKHMQLHMDGNKYICSECGKILGSKGSLRKHMFVHNEQVELKCDVCPKVYTRSQKLLSHRRKHKEPMPFTCTVCQLGFLSVVTLSRHESMNHKTYDIVKQE